MTIDDEEDVTTIVICAWSHGCPHFPEAAHKVDASMEGGCIWCRREHYDDFGNLTHVEEPRRA